MRNRRVIIINDKLFDLWSEFGVTWFIDKEGANDFGIYGGMSLEKWIDVDYLNKVKGNERTTIKTVEVC